jgi:Fe2+ or Zn2+ uptake regulation protein
MGLFRQSAQRQAVLTYLKSVTSHPTAAAIFRELRRKFPRLSLGTVYRNLDILQRQGQVRVLAGEGRESRYDADMRPHGHFSCRLCGTVEDLAWLGEWLQAAAARSREQRVEEISLEARGICGSCRRARTKGGRKR